MKNDNEFYDQSYEENKEYEQTLNENISNFKSQVNKNSLEIIQHSGTAGMVDMQEHTQRWEDGRSFFHTKEATDLLFETSPKNSPSEKHIDINKNLVMAQQLDDKEAVQEDIDNIKGLKITLVKTLLSQAADSGTNMNYDDDMNDLF